MLKILTADELAKKTAKGTITTIYGLPDSGKSTFMISVAEKMKVLFIDSEGKFGKICQNAPNFEKYKDNISGVKVDTFKELVDVVSDPQASEFDAIVIDSITALVDKQSHDIMYKQKRTRSYNDYAEIGTQFFEALTKLQKNGVSSFLSIQAGEEKATGLIAPDTDGNMVQKHATRYADWMFYIEDNGGERALNIKNNTTCRLKKKNIPTDFPDQLIGEKVNFASLWSVFPSKNVKEEKKKEREESKKKKEQDQKAYIKKIKATKTIEELMVVWKEIVSFGVATSPEITKAKDDQKLKVK